MDNLKAKDVVTLFINLSRHQIAMITEGLVCQAALESEYSSHVMIKAFENGQVDLAIYLGQERCTGSVIDRLFNDPGIRASAEHIGFDVKSTSVCLDKGGGAWIQPCLTPNQLAIRPFLLVTAVQQPGYLAIIPASCMKWGMAGSAWVQLSRFRFGLHQVPGFPYEWGPAILPLSRIGELLAGFRSWFLQETDTWPNPQTGVHLDRLSVLELERRNGSILVPTLPEWRTAMEEVGIMYRVFREHSRQFRVECVRYSPLLGDFKLVNILEPSQVTFVELKAKHCERISGSENGLVTFRHLQTLLGFTSRPLFTWRANWDYLLTILDNDSALFIPRDQVPILWWNVPLEDDKVWLYWTMQEAEVSNYLVLREPTALVSGMERALRKNGWEASNAIPLAPLKFEELAEVEETVSVETTSSLRFDNIASGFGQRCDLVPRADTHALWSSHALMNLCRFRGKNIVLSFGSTNPRCSHAIAPFVWSDEHKERFDKYGEHPRQSWEFDQDYPMVPLCFLRLSWTTGPGPSYRWTNTLRRNCLILCDTFPWQSVRLRHGRFIVPYEHFLNAPAESGPHRKYQRNRVELAEGAIDRYCVDESEVVDALLEPLTGEATSSVFARSADLTAGNPYVCFLKEIWEAGLEPLNKALQSSPSPDTLAEDQDYADGDSEVTDNDASSNDEGDGHDEGGRHDEGDSSSEADGNDEAGGNDDDDYNDEAGGNDDDDDYNDDGEYTDDESEIVYEDAIGDDEEEDYNEDDEDDDEDEEDDDRDYDNDDDYHEGGSTVSNDDEPGDEDAEEGLERTSDMGNAQTGA